MTQDLRQTDTPPGWQTDARQASLYYEKTTLDTSDEANKFSPHCLTSLFSFTIEGPSEDHLF